MYIHPELAIGVARDHQRRLRAEADAFRQLAQARRNGRAATPSGGQRRPATSGGSSRPATSGGSSRPATSGGSSRPAGVTPPVRSRPAGTLAPCEPSVAA